MEDLGPEAWNCGEVIFVGLAEFGCEECFFGKDEAELKDAEEKHCAECTGRRHEVSNGEQCAPGSPIEWIARVAIGTVGD